MSGTVENCKREFYTRSIRRICAKRSSKSLGLAIHSAPLRGTIGNRFVTDCQYEGWEDKSVVMFYRCTNILLDVVEKSGLSQRVVQIYAPSWEH